ncbi:MAG: histidine kinase [Cellulophaga sp.]
MIKKFFIKYLFWVIQLVSWGLFSAFSIKMAGILDGYKGFFVLFLAILLPGIITTSILRWFLKRYVSIKKFSFKGALKIGAGIIIAVFLYVKTNYLFGEIAGFFFRNIAINRESEFAKMGANTVAMYASYIMIVVGWTVLYFVVKILRQYYDSKIDRLKLKDKIRQAQLNTLKGHVNPQFLFASLNDIKELMLEDVSKSRAMLTKLSEMLRYSLTMNNVNLVRLEEELEIVESYLELVNIGNTGTYKISLEIEDVTLKLEVPPMLLTNLVEIATRQNSTFQINRDIKLIVRTQNSNELQLQVMYSGNGTETKESNSLKKTITQRLKLLYKGKAIFSSVHELNYTTLIVLLPISNSKTRQDGVA